ncbi:MAG: hypothetical protein JSV56_06805 [Methanomassiliicoccales archaeon]|nr:MAG: hypothetical protein JSV56_06805 [Methanomassiliicoccales archaeon]
MIDNAKFQLTVGSKYRIRSLESRDKPLISQGVFKGYTAFGHDDAICLELDDSHETDSGKIRVIPAHMVIALDVLSAAEDKEFKEKDEEASRYFG